MTIAEALIEIGELARRSGVAVSALRFYEERGLIEALRSPGNRRRFPRSTLRKVALIRAAQAIGLPLSAVASALAGLPHGRAPTRADWEALSSGWATLLDQRIAAMMRLGRRSAHALAADAYRWTAAPSTMPAIRRARWARDHATCWATLRRTSVKSDELSTLRVLGGISSHDLLGRAGYRARLCTSHAIRPAYWSA